MLSRFFAVVLSLGLLTFSAVADDWVAAKLRGEVLQLIDGDWQPLKRGDIVPDDRVIRTLSGGRVEFHRDAEVIALGPQTQIQIFDKTGKRFTTVKQYFGEVAVEAEVQNVQHFAVETPFLAAVVKGTRFVVTSGKNTASVAVQRGHVAVESLVTHSRTLIAAGQSANAGAGIELAVKGKGDLPDIVNAEGEIIAIDGKPVDDEKLAKALTKTALEAQKAADKAAKKAAKLLKEGDKEAAKIAQEASKAADKAAKDAAKAAKDLAKDADKAAKDVAKDADKAAKDAAKAADKAAKDAAKAAKDAAKETKNTVSNTVTTTTNTVTNTVNNTVTTTTGLLGGLL